MLTYIPVKIAVTFICLFVLSLVVSFFRIFSICEYTFAYIVYIYIYIYMYLFGEQNIVLVLVQRVDSDK